MKIKKLPFLILTGLVLSSSIISHFNLKNRIENSPTLLVEKSKINLPIAEVSVSLPIRLKIPKINIDATVESVGLTSDGAMDAPKGPSNVAWFELGPHPGEIGSSVIDGHSGYKNNKPAVFDNLYKLEKGDKIYIQDEKGAIITFVVREFRSYDPQADAENVFSSNDGQAHLNLITCSGDWNPVEKTHSNRLVVFTDKEME